MESSFNSFRFAASLEEWIRNNENTFDDFSSPLSYLTKEKFAELSAGISNIDTSQSEYIESAVFQAAFSGYFDPTSLVKMPSEPGMRVEILKHLARFCKIDSINGNSIWILNRTKRKEILEKRALLGNMASVRGEELPPTDAMGYKLRNILFNETTPDTYQKRTDLLAYASALETLENINISKPDLTQLRIKVNYTNFLVQQGIDEEHIFIGRNEELSRLIEFVKAPGRKRWDGFVLTGTGGAGKSALLSKFMLEILEQKSGSVVTLDFDRPGMNIGDTYWLESEIVRQIESQTLNRDDSINAARNNIRRQIINDDSFLTESNRERAAKQRSYRKILTNLRQLLLKTENADRPFILILDTYEEVSQNNATSKLLNWLDDISEYLRPLKVKVIFSGRLFDDVPNFSPLAKFDSIHLNEFDDKLTEYFLTVQGIRQPTAKKLAKNKLFPKRPLELKLLAKLIVRDGEQVIAQLENDLKAGTQNNTMMFTGLVYRRVLLRLHDPVLRKLAYPGLILRYMTTNIIREILVPALGLYPMTAKESELVFNNLANYGWLAYRQSDKLWHRKDLRRAMLHVMIANEREAAEKIHKLAITYFGKGNTDADRAEVFYHQMMLGKDDAFPLNINSDDAKWISENLLSDVADFPKNATVYYNYVLYNIISSRDIRYLPEALKEGAYHQLGNQLLDNQDYLNALSLIRNAQFTNRETSDQAGSEWQGEVLISTVNWTRLKRYYSDFSRLGSFRMAVNQFFIAIITGVATLDIISTYLEEYVKGPDFLKQVESESSELSPILGKFSFCIIVLKANGTLGRSILVNIINFIAVLRKLVYGKMSTEIYRSIILFELAINKKFFPNYLMTTTFAKLEVNWLGNRKNSSTSNVIIQQIGGMLDLLEALQSSKKQQANLPTIHKFLASIDSLASFKTPENYNAYPAIDRITDFTVIQGPFPDLRICVKFALLDTFKTKRSYAKLAPIIRKFIPVDLDGLDELSFTNAMTLNAERELNAYIELIDRSWLLEPFLHNIVSIFPRFEKIKEVHKVCDLWYKSYEFVWEHTKDSGYTLETN